MLRRKYEAAFSLPAFTLHLRERDRRAFRTFLRQNRPADPGD